MVTESINFYTFHCHISNNTDVWIHQIDKVVHQIDRKNGRLIISVNFMAKFGLVFVSGKHI